MTAKEKAILTEPVPRVMTLLIWPIAINGALSMAYNLADSFFLGRIGDVEVAAGALTSSIIMVVLNFANGLALGGGILVGQKIGAGKRDEAKSYIINTFITVLIIGFFLGILAVFSLPVLLRWVGAGSGELFQKSYLYAVIIYLITPLTMIIAAYSSVRRSQGMPVRPTVLTGISIILNVLFNSISIFVLDLGILGIALSTVLAKLILVIYIFFEMLYRSPDWEIRLENIRISLSHVKAILKVGIPLSLAATVVSLGFTFMTKLAVRFGEDFLIIFGISSRINSIIFVISGSIGMAFSVFVSLNYGSGNHERIKKGLNFAMLVSVLWGILSIVGTFFLPRHLIGFFTVNSLIIERAIPYVFFMATANLFWSPYAVFSKFLEGCGLTKITMYLNIARFWFMRVPMAYFFALMTSLGEFGLPLATVLSCLFCLIIALMYYRMAGRERIFRGSLL